MQVQCFRPLLDTICVWSNMKFTLNLLHCWLYSVLQQGYFLFKAANKVVQDGAKVGLQLLIWKINTISNNARINSANLPLSRPVLSSEVIKCSGNCHLGKKKIKGMTLASLGLSPDEGHQPIKIPKPAATSLLLLWHRDQRCFPERGDSPWTHRS